MRPRRIAVAAALTLIVATATYAQPPTRADETRAARDAKARAATAPDPGRVERFLNALERRALLQNVMAPPDGFGVRVGGIDEGGGLALGPIWRNTRIAGGQLELHASAAMSIRRDREIDLGARLPHLVGGRARLTIGATATELPQERFYGLGIDSELAARTVFGMTRRTVTASVAVNPARLLELEAGGGVLHTRLWNAVDSGPVAPDIDFLHARMAATVDYRDQPGNPRSGGRYHVAFQRFAGTRPARASFNRLDAELEQHLSAWKKQRLVTLRVVGSFSDADAGHDVPFYLQRTLGGSRLLRGFVHDRFRDRHLVVLQGEYAWDVSPFLNAVLFYETGMVAPRASELRLSNMRRDYGFGLRIGSARSVALRTDVAFGSGEGTRFIMRFNHAF
jgi:outer membrane translocation and assembly module TamA